MCGTLFCFNTWHYNYPIKFDGFKHLLFLLQVKAADNRVIQDQLNEKVRYALELTLFLLR
jgi:hypothetical protein